MCYEIRRAEACVDLNNKFFPRSLWSGLCPPLSLSFSLSCALFLSPSPAPSLSGSLSLSLSLHRVNAVAVLLDSGEEAAKEGEENGKSSDEGSSQRSSCSFFTAAQAAGDKMQSEQQELEQNVRVQVDKLERPLRNSVCLSR
jgi:hypothetical protein